MARKITRLDDVPVDVVEAVKRGFIHRGLIPRKFRRNDPLSDDFVLKKDDGGSQKENSSKDEGGVKQRDRSEFASGSKSGGKTGARKASGKIEAQDPDIAIIDSQPGSQEAAKDPDEVEPGEIHEKLIDITEKAHDVLFAAKTVFPFTPVPSKITLDREKLSIINRSFFRVAKILTVPVSSMISAEVSLGPLFGSVEMTSKYFVDNKHTIEYMQRKEAQTLHSLLQGFILAHERGLDVSEVDKEDLCVLLQDLGQS